MDRDTAIQKIKEAMGIAIDALINEEANEQYIQDFEEENENLSEENRMLTERVKELSDV